MGLSRNKVAVSEGAAGSPPFYGEPTDLGSEAYKSSLNSDRENLGEQVQLWYRDCCSIFDDRRILHGGVAQLGEHLPCKQGVMGSNPIISTRSKGFTK